MQCKLMPRPGLRKTNALLLTWEVEGEFEGSRDSWKQSREIENGEELWKEKLRSIVSQVLVVPKLVIFKAELWHSKQG